MIMKCVVNILNNVGVRKIYGVEMCHCWNGSYSVIINFSKLKIILIKKLKIFCTTTQDMSK